MNNPDTTKHIGDIINSLDEPVPDERTVAERFAETLHYWQRVTGERDSGHVTRQLEWLSLLAQHGCVSKLIAELECVEMCPDATKALGVIDNPGAFIETKLKGIAQWHRFQPPATRG